LIKGRIVVFGASGFVGSAVVVALETRGVDVVCIPAPRLPATALKSAPAFVSSNPQTVNGLADQLRGADAVINAAGNPDASATDERALVAANSLVPAILAGAATAAGVPRFIHVSSAVVQGDAPILNDSPRTVPFSAYSRSKALGEQFVSSLAPESCVIYRPASVHAVDRRVTRMTAAIARSPLATVAGSGNQPTPQALLSNVADAIAHLATSEHQPPIIVTHPWESLTTAQVLTLLGGKPPKRIPIFLARSVVAVLRIAGRGYEPVAANARRVEMLWFGQKQATSWLSLDGWTPCAGQEEWKAVGQALAAQR